MNSHYEIWQDGMRVADVDGPEDMAYSNAMHYAMVYEQDGPVQVFRRDGRKKTLISVRFPESASANEGARVTQDKLND